MSEHKLSILVAAIGAAKAARDLKGVDGAVSRIGSHAGRGLRTAAGNLAGLTAVAGAGIAVAVKTGLDDLATLESAVTSVDGAIKAMGKTGMVTGAQVATWANEIESSVGAAFDDKDITAATATLIRFGKLSVKNLKPAMVVMTDLAAKTGSVESASALLAKALADPTKAAGKLARAGVILTKQQQAQIKAMVKAGDVAGAQKVLLDALAKTTKGAAAASQGPYARALATLSDVSEDARKALAEGFLPVIEKVAKLLSTELAKPETMKNIREFGQGLASGLDSVIEIVRGLPWTTIGDSLRIAGAGGKALLSAFTSMPPWVQSAVLTGWGLNKLTGGALGGIVGELGKGLIKGVLGMNAGVVNLKAGVVNGGGGPGGAGAAAGGTGVAGTVAALASAGVFAEIAYQATEAIGDAAKSVFAEVGANDSQNALLAKAVDGLQNLTLPGMDQLHHLDEIPGKLGMIADALQGKRGWTDSGTSQGPTRATNTNDPTGFLASPMAQKLVSQQADTHAEQIATTKAVQDGTAKQGESIIAFRNGERATTGGLRSVEGATRSGTSGTTAATNVSASRIVGAIQANRPVVTTNVNVNVSASQVTKSTTTQERLGPGTGSAGSGSNGANKPT